MSLRHAILTALLEKPTSGLDLTRRFDKSFQFFWSATHQQVYRELNKLEDEGLIESSTPQPPTRGTPKRFAVRPAGRRELAKWVSEQQDPKPLRESLLVRLRAAAMVGAGDLPRELKRHLLHHEAQMAQYLEIADREFDSVEPSPVTDIHRLILQAGIDLEQYWITWISDALNVLSGPPPATRPRRRASTSSATTAAQMKSSRKPS